MQRPSIPYISGISGLSSGLTTGLSSLASLAAFVRDRLAEVAPKSGALMPRHDDMHPEQTTPDTVRHLFVAAAAPFASTSYARARLLRQMHASGLLSERETEQAEHYLGVAQ